MEYHSFLRSNVRSSFPKRNKPKFPSPYGVSFILTFCIALVCSEYIFSVSVSLRSYIHSYKKIVDVYKVFVGTHEFPSPYRVIFILTFKKASTFNKEKVEEFPSPYGVIFILTRRIFHKLVKERS